MTTTAYVWPPHGPQVGHASVGVEGPSGKTYISWWPSDEGKAAPGTIKSGRAMSILIGVQGTRFTYDQDKAGEGGREPYKINLEGLDEPAIIKWWDEFSLQNWSLLNINCAQVAVDALRAGGASRFTGGLEGWLSSWQATYWKPMEVYRFAMAVQSGMAARAGR